MQGPQTWRERSSLPAYGLVFKNGRLVHNYRKKWVFTSVDRSIRRRRRAWGLRWLKDSAQLGCRRAAAALYRVYRGQAKTSELYHYYLRRAAVLGWPPAEYDTGVLYLDGSGTAKNRAKAIAWLEKAAATKGIIGIKAEKLLIALRSEAPVKKN